VYSPNHFIALSVLLSAMVPIYMAASNWGAIGRKRSKALCLFCGWLGFASLFSVLFFLSESTGRVAGLPVYLLNLPIGYVLRDKQRPIYDAAVRLGARPASMWKGSIIGLGLVLCALAVPVVGFTVVTEIQVRHGLVLLSEKKHEEAAAVFGSILRREPDNAGAVFNLALCDVLMERWDQAASGFEKYLEKDKTNAAAYAFLGYARSRQGRLAEARELTSKARALDPGIVERLFDVGSKPEGTRDSGRETKR
jgi:tetratricopeptide (TPR) repeat protein